MPKDALETTAARAAATLAGGCDSPVRSGWAVGGEPFIQCGGRGAYAFDERGDRYVDYIMAYGPLLFGHTHPALTSNLDALASDGVVWGNTHGEEIRLAERIRASLPVMERIRFVTTGTEAVMSAIRVARAHTGKDLILRFAGNYHGHFDLALLGAGASAHTEVGERSGIPAAAMHDAIVARYNDLNSVDELLRGRENELAAIVVEPICGNMGLVMPEDGFLPGLRERCDRYGALLLFDEIVTWLRFGLHGAQAIAGVAPDMTMLGKIMGGGFPIAAFGGREEIMNVLAPVGPTFTGGTHAGNPFGVGMAHRVLDLLETHAEYYAQMEYLAQRLAEGIRAILARCNLSYAVVQFGSVVDFKFRPGGPNRNYDHALAADSAAYARFYHGMRARKILLPPSQNEVMFVSTAHGMPDIDETLAAMDDYWRTGAG